MITDDTPTPLRTVTVCSFNAPDGPPWCAVADWDDQRKCYITRDPMYAHPAVTPETDTGA